MINQLRNQLQACKDEKAANERGCAQQLNDLQIQLNQKITDAEAAQVKADQDRDDLLK